MAKIQARTGAPLVGQPNWRVVLPFMMQCAQWALFVTLLAPPAQACPGWFRLLSARPQATGYRGIEAWKTFFKLRLRANKALTAEEQAKLKEEPVAVLALLEVLGGGTRGTHLRNLARQLRRAPASERHRIRHFLTQLDLSQGLSDVRALNEIERLYLLVNGPERAYPGVPGFFARRLPTGLRRALRDRVQSAILGEDFAAGLQKLGLLRERRHVEEFRQWLAERPNFVELSFSAAINAFTMSAVGLPLHVPQAQLLRARLLRPELLDKVRRYGFDAVYDEVKAELGNSARFDLAWNTFRAAAYQALQAAALYYAATHPQQTLAMLNPLNWNFLYRLGLVTDDDTKKREQENLEREREEYANRIRREQFRSFKEAFALTAEPNVNLPDPWDPEFERKAPAAYAEEAKRTWKNLQESKLEDLLAHPPK